MTPAKAIITDIQRSSVHDGPGFRTTVFFKGCQLHCEWCHNPETISFEPETLCYPEKCIGCGKCDEGCFSGAKVLCGKKMTVEQVFRQIVLDKPYYGKDGGVTLSGGEPLCQADFARELLMACRVNDIQTAIESNLSVRWDVAKPVLELLSVMMIDLKIWDEEKHVRYTGLGNALVRENLIKAQELEIPLVLRTPVIPGVNAYEDEISAIAGFAKGLKNLKYYELLSYHPLGQSKAQALGKTITEFEKPTKQLLRELADCAREAGVPVVVNGVRAEAFFGE